MKLLVVCALFFGFSANTKACQLKVIDNQAMKEKTYFISEFPYKVNLPKTAWSCHVKNIYYEGKNTYNYDCRIGSASFSSSSVFGSRSSSVISIDQGEKGNYTLGLLKCRD